MSIAVYAFSGDPITFGHIDIIKRAANVFDQVIVGIGQNPHKSYTFTLEEREEMAKKSLKNLKNVTVKSFHGLLVDFAYENKAHVIVKGIRTEQDFNYEQNLHLIGDSQKLGIDTFLLISKPELAHISSSNVKDIQLEQGLIHEYVPLFVKKYLEQKLSGQYIVALTGEIGAGKSYIAEKLILLGQKYNLEVHEIDLDEITHQIYNSLKEPKYSEIRETIINKFGQNIKNPDGSINRKALGEIVFNDKEKLMILNEIMYTPLMVRMRRELYQKRGLILLNAALIIESDMTYLANNDCIVVKSSSKDQLTRLKNRGLNRDQIQRRLDSQYTCQQKITKLEKIIKKDQQGQIFPFNNLEPIEPLLDKLLTNLCHYFHLNLQKS